MIGQAAKEGIGSRFVSAMSTKDPIDKFLLDAVDYVESGRWIFEGSKKK